MGIERIVTDAMVFEIADSLAANGEKVTNRAIWSAIGGGSMTTISQALRHWKEQQEIQVSQPIERAPLPASVLDVLHQAAAQLWETAQAETKAELEQLAQATNARIAEAHAERDDTLAELQATAEELEQVRAERDTARRRDGVGRPSVDASPRARGDGAGMRPVHRRVGARMTPIFNAARFAILGGQIRSAGRVRAGLAPEAHRSGPEGPALSGGRIGRGRQQDADRDCGLGARRRSDGGARRGRRPRQVVRRSQGLRLYCSRRRRTGRSRSRHRLAAGRLHRSA